MKDGILVNIFITTTIIITITNTNPTENDKTKRDENIENDYSGGTTIKEGPKVYDPALGEGISFDVANFVDTIIKSNKKNIIIKINDQLNEIYDNNTAFVHSCAGLEMEELMKLHKEKRVDRMKTHVDYFYYYKQIYSELLNGFKNVAMTDLTESIKKSIRKKYKANAITYEEYIEKDKELDAKLIFVNKALRSAIVNHILNVEYSMFQDFFTNYKHVLEDEKLLKPL